MRLIVFLVMPLSLGCGPSEAEQKLQSAQSQVETLAEDWSLGREVKFDEPDPWGNTLRTFTVRNNVRLDVRYEVRSAGPDGKFYTRDDIRATRLAPIKDASKVAGKAAGNIVEGGVRGAIKGATKPEEKP